MEEGAVLIVLKAFVQLMLPNDATSAFEVDKLEVESGFVKIADESDGTLNACVAPL